MGEILSVSIKECDLRPYIKITKKADWNIMAKLLQCKSCRSVKSATLDDSTVSVDTITAFKRKLRETGR